MKKIILITAFALTSCATSNHQGTQTGKAVIVGAKTSWFQQVMRVIPLVKFSVGWNGIDFGISIGNPNVPDLTQAAETITEKTGVQINTR